MNTDYNPLVVIRCITYNHEPYIRNALEGFVSQITNFPFVAIVHDDASTDGTVSIIKEYAEKYPDIIKPIFETENQYSKHDGSLSRIMDSASREYNAKYYSVCEGDDYWIDPFKLQKQVDFLEQNPDYVLVHTSFNTIIGDNIRRNNFHWKSGYVLRELLSNQYSIGTLTTTYRVSSYNEIPRLFCNKRFKMGDLPLWIELAHIGKFKYFDETTAVYRVLPESASHSKSLSKRLSFINGAFDIRAFYCDAFKEGNIDVKRIELLSIMKVAIIYHDWPLFKKTFEDLKLSGYKIPLKYYIIYYSKSIRILKYIIGTIS